MQKLRERRLTNTPWDVPQVPCNCGLSLNREETLGVAGLKTSLNNPDAALTGFGSSEIARCIYRLSGLKNSHLSLLGRENTLLTERSGCSSPCLKTGVSAA